MKESIGGVSLFSIVIFFIFIFTSYVCLSINSSKAYNIRNELVNIIKNQGGVCTDSSSGNCANFKEQIVDYFKEAAYRSVGDCNKGGNVGLDDSGWVGYSREGDLISDGKKAAFCVKAISAKTNSELSNALYYKVKVFYRLDIPVISNIFEFSVMGETGRIYEPNECTYENDRYYWCS